MWAGNFLSFSGTNNLRLFCGSSRPPSIVWIPAHRGCVLRLGYSGELHNILWPLSYNIYRIKISVKSLIRYMLYEGGHRLNGCGNSLPYLMSASPGTGQSSSWKYRDLNEFRKLCNGLVSVICFMYAHLSIFHSQCKHISWQNIFQHPLHNIAPSDR